MSQLSRQEDNSARYGSGEGSGGYGFGGYGSGGYGWIRIALGCCCRRIFSWLFQSLQYFHFLFTFLVFALKQTNFQPNMREKRVLTITSGHHSGCLLRSKIRFNCHQA